MPLLRLDHVSLHYGTQVLLDDASLTLRRGLRIGLLGRNGAGKTTLLRVIAGALAFDAGERWVRPGIRIAWLDQNLPDADGQSVYEVVAGGLADVGDLLRAYHHLLQQPQPDLKQLEQLQAQVEAQDGWALEQKVDRILTRLNLPADALMASLSGGWRKRVALARALVNEPDILLLDEPTNHLDITTIEWLEKQILDFRGALLLVTHDRAFLQRVSNSIIELDRGNLYPWDGDYRGFLEYREQQLAAEEKANSLFDKRLAEEEKWIRQGIKARRTRNEGRVRALEDMRAQRAARRERQGSAGFSLERAGNSGKIVAELSGVTQRYDGRPVIENFSTLILRGDRIGIVGANGAGKSTLLKILLGEIEPQEGNVKRGTSLEIAYFDQLRQQLDPELNLLDNICEGREFIAINGKNRHGISYLGDFLFTPERIRTPVKALSGGEQNRAILAKLFSKPANVLVLDEPTNDLDIETLELLEEILLGFDGTVLLVSHDRAFMDNVVTSILVFEGGGVISEHVGGYSDWAARGGSLAEASIGGRQAAARNGADVVPPATDRRADDRVPTTTRPKLSYRDQRELDALPGQIEVLEARQSELEQSLADPQFYQQPRRVVDGLLAELAAIQSQLERAYGRWAELEG